MKRLVLLIASLLWVTTALAANDYYVHDTERIATGSTARSSQINTIGDNIEDGFDLLPSTADFYDGKVNWGADSGAADAYVVTTTKGMTALSAGCRVGFLPSAANTGASTINVDGLGAKDIKRPDNSALEANDIIVNQPVVLVYNGTNWRFESGHPLQLYSDRPTKTYVDAAVAAGGDPGTIEYTSLATTGATGGRNIRVNATADALEEQAFTASKAIVSDASGNLTQSAATSTEVGYLSGVTSAIQTQLNAKQATITGAATSIDTEDLSASKALVSDASGKVAVSTATADQVGYLSNVTSDVQVQLNGKQATVTGAATTITSSDLTASRALASNGTGKVAVSATTSTELGYLSGTTSAVQTQLNAKLATADIDDTPVNGETAAPISSNWAYDHAADVTTIHLPAQSSSTTGKVLVSSGSAASWGAAPGFKNRIIGGDFSSNLWRRGTTFTGLTTATNVAERFTYAASSDAVVDVKKATDAPTVAQAGVYSQHSLHVDVTTADASMGATQYAAVSQAIEGFNVADFGFGQSGTRYVTLSFWHKHTKTGTYCAAIRNNAVDRTYVKEYTQAVSNTWEKATLTFPVDTSGTWEYETNLGLRVFFTIAAGSSIQTTADTWTAGAQIATANQVNALDSITNDFKIDLVQLEGGSIATDFEFRPTGVERVLLNRYFNKLGGEAASDISLGGYGVASGVSYQTLALPVAMRTTPTGAKVGTWTVSNCGQPSIAAASSVSVVLGTTVTGTASYFTGTADTTTYITLDAEF